MGVALKMSIYWCDKCKLYSTTETCPACGRKLEQEDPPYEIKSVCKKCGYLYSNGDKCLKCGTAVVFISDEDIVNHVNYKENIKKEPDSRQKWSIDRKRIALKYIQDEPEFDQSAFDKIFEEDMQRAIEYDKKRNAPPAPPPKPVVECPYCHSKNTSKISSLSKAVSIAAFGLFSQKRKYQWHCNNCRSDF